MTLEEFNTLSHEDIFNELKRCCGCKRWIERMKMQRPFDSFSSIYKFANDVWRSLSEDDWKEAFTHHPKIGDIADVRKRFATTRTWAEGEQKGVQNAPDETIRQIAEGNTRYEKRFGYIFIVCATGKNADEMLLLLNERLRNDPEQEILIASEEQRKITALRLEKLFSRSGS